VKSLERPRARDGTRRPTWSRLIALRASRVITVTRDVEQGGSGGKLTRIGRHAIAQCDGIATRIGQHAIAQYVVRVVRLISVRSWSLVVISTSLLGLTASTTAARLARTASPVRLSVPHVATVAAHEVAPVTPVTPVVPALHASFDIDVRGLRRHVQAIAKLIGHPASELAAKLGATATVGDGSIEWNLVDVGVDAATAYGYASVVDGKVTGFVIRGRASLDKLLKLHLHRPLQLTQAGGERPSYSIAAGE